MGKLAVAFLRRFIIGAGRFFSGKEVAEQNPSAINSDARPPLPLFSIPMEIDTLKSARVVWSKWFILAILRMVAKSKITTTIVKGVPIFVVNLLAIFRSENKTVHGDVLDLPIDAIEPSVRIKAMPFPIPFSEPIPPRKPIEVTGIDGGILPLRKRNKSVRFGKWLSNRVTRLDATSLHVPTPNRNLLLGHTLTVLAFCLVFSSQISGQALVPWSDLVLTSRGTPAGGASVAVCANPGLATTGATLTSNIAILTMSSNPVTAGFVANMSLSVAGFTGADTYFNGSFTILTVTSTTITYALTHANGSASSNGTAFQTGNSSTSCAPLSSIFSDAGGLVPITQPGFTADGLGNYAFYAASGNYNIQFYGPVLSVRVKPVNLPCAGSCSFSTLTVSGAATFTGAPAISVSNVGVFTNAQMNEYLDSLINGCAPLSEYQATQGNTNYATDGLLGCVLSGAGSAVYQSNGVSGFVNNASTTTNAVGVYGQGRATANSAKVWGMNPVVQDLTGISNAQLTGMEIDANLNNTSATVEGLLLQGASSAQPSGQAIGFVLNHLGSGVTWNTGIQINTTAVTPTGFGILVNSGMLGTNQVTNAGGSNGDIILRNANYLRSGSQINNATFRLIGGNSSNQVVVDPDAQGTVLSGAVSLANTFAPSTAGGRDLGLAAFPFGNLWLGASAASQFKFAPAATAAARTVAMPDPLANVSLGFSYNATNPVYQSKRAVAGCTTGAAAGNSCASDITVTWGTAFADANYSVTCTGSTPTNVPSAPFVVSASKLAASVHINYFAITAAAASYATIDCIAVHD